MKTSLSRALFWAPRILGMLFVPFLMMFSLDVFEEAHGFREIAVGLIMHNLPALTLVLFLWLAWKREWAGAALFPLAGVFYIWLTWSQSSAVAKLLIAGPPIVTGMLFALAWTERRKRSAREERISA